MRALEWLVRGVAGRVYDERPTRRRVRGPEAERETVAAVYVGVYHARGV